MSTLAVGILLFAIFIIFAAVMYTGKLPAFIAMPLMATALFITGGMFFYDLSLHVPGSNMLYFAKEFERVVIREGMPRLWPYVITVLLGAILAELLKESGITRTIIRWASELGGDNRIVLCILLTGATSLLFISLGGLGAVIMVATIVLPIFLNIGISAPVAGSLFLFGMSLGGALNPVNQAFFVEILKTSGMTPQAAQMMILSFVKPFFAVFLLLVIFFIIINARKKGASSFWALPAGEDAAAPGFKVGFSALLTPIVPIALVLGCNIAATVTKNMAFDIYRDTALLTGIIYCLIVTGPGPRGRIQRLTKAIFESMGAIAPVAALIVGIGMVVNAAMSPVVSTFMAPLLHKVVPGSPVAYVIFFTIAAPLALYRGPLNVWGMGAAIASIIISAKILPPGAVMAALYSVGMIQGVSDPTNTHNAWIASFLGQDVQSFTKKTLLYTWLLALAGLIISAIMFF